MRGNSHIESKAPRRCAKPSAPISPAARKLCKLREQIKIEFDRFKSLARLATHGDLKKIEKRIMSKIATYLENQKAFNTAQVETNAAVVTSVTGIIADVTSLNEKILVLQNSAGEATAEDQVTINQLETDGAALVAKMKGVSDALAALDAQTPPVVPSAPA